MSVRATKLCTREALARTGAKSVTVGAPPNARHIVIVDAGGTPLAYENSCPHLRMPLEILADHFLDEARQHLVCRTHGARFAIRDGYCVSGPCKGAWLKAVAITERGAEIWLSDSDDGLLPM